MTPTLKDEETAPIKEIDKKEEVIIAKKPDPGKNLATHELRKTERIKVWKRPANKKDRDDARAERLADWEATR